jgi:exopolyphosphatase/guanosine-5'-triphosphate,3'-diphosphate pyrophosphatase
MYKAVIDIGTNTFHLLIGKVIDQKVTILFKDTIAVKLGEGGGISKGEIIPAAYQRGLDTLKLFNTEIQKRNISVIKATATAAVRDAKNGKQFIQDVYNLTHIKIDIIDGQEEASYIYLGAKAAAALGKHSSLVMDIGGGSVEFIICNQQNILWKDSFRIGAARLLSDFYKNDPLLDEDIKQLNQHLDNVLSSLKEALAKYQPEELIGTAGAFDSYRDIILMEEYSNLNSEIVLVPLNQDHFLELLNSLITSTHQERTEIKGLIPLRTDMILMSSLLCKYVLEESNIKKTTSCSYSLKEGLLYSI